MTSSLNGRTIKLFQIVIGRLFNLRHPLIFISRNKSTQMVEKINKIIYEISIWPMNAI